VERISLQPTTPFK